MAKFDQNLSQVNQMSSLASDPHTSPRSSEPFTKEELSFLQKRNIRVDLENCVGKGTFGTLYVALSHQFGYVVLKRYESYTQAYNETEALRLLGKERQHYNIITYYGSYVFKNHLYIMIEYSNVGDLGQFYLDYYAKREPSESEIFEIFYEIYSGVEHMHRNGWAHRDLKFENVVGFRDVLNPRFITFKLTDFGSATPGFGKNGNCLYYQTFSGSPFTMPPEVTQRPYNVFLHDTYSLGVILYGLSHNRDFPHPPDSQYDWHQKDKWLINHNKKKHDLQSVRFKESVSQELKSLILSVIEPNPQKRISLQRIKVSKWWTIRKHEWQHNNNQFCHYPNLH